MSTAAIALALAVMLSGRASRARLRRCRGAPANADGESGRTRVDAGDPFAAASALDVFATCLSAGMGVAAAARATAPSAPAELAAMLRRSADLLALGAEPAVAWAEPAGTDGDDRCRAVGHALFRLARRSASSGTALADGVAELAVEARHRAAHDAAAAGERAGVLIAGPLGICFLPAFICLGVIPVVAGLARDTFVSGLL